jgi:hypothetical protein
MRDSRPVITQPSSTGPGGDGQLSGQRGTVLESGDLLYA